MKLKNVILVDDNGDNYEVELKDFVKKIKKEFNPKDFTSDDLGDVTGDAAIEHIIKAASTGKEMNEEIKSEYADIVAFVEETIERTKSGTEDKKEKAKAEKEAREAAKAAEKEAKEKEALALANEQKAFVGEVAKGAELADSEFTSELESLAKNLPTGVRVINSGGGYGIEFDEGVDKSVVGQALGYIIQKEANSSFLANQLQFWVGDMTIKLVENNLFQTAKDAANHISELLEKEHGKRLSAGNISAYKLMAERTPVALRNPKADATAYLAISASKTPRRGDQEEMEDFKKRVAAFESDREELQKKLASGEITRRKDILPKVEEWLIKHGLKEQKKEVVSISQLQSVFFHASFALEELLDVHEEGLIVYQNGKDLIKVTKEEMEKQKQDSYNNLMNALYGSSKKYELRELVRGFKEKENMVEVSKDSEGKPVMEPQKTKIPIYPVPFFEVESNEPTQD